MCNEDAPAGRSDQRVDPVAVVMGVAGSGKSSCGEALAATLGVPYADADVFHSEANVATMAAGHPLTDEDRAPWLAAIGRWLHEHRDTGAVVTCSALKRAYRDQLRAHVSGVPFLHLDGPAEVVTERVSHRPGHFMPASLVTSQYATLEPLQDDEPGLVLDFTRPIDELVEQMRAYLTSVRA